MLHFIDCDEESLNENDSSSCSEDKSLSLF